MEELNAIEHLHADRIDRIDRYINEKWGGEIDLRTVIVLVIKDLQGECERLRAVNAELMATLQNIAEHNDFCSDWPHDIENMQERARAALAKAKDFGSTNPAITSQDQQLPLKSFDNLVGGRGIEPLTPSMSRKQP